MPPAALITPAAAFTPPAVPGYCTCPVSGAITRTFSGVPVAAFVPVVACVPVAALLPDPPELPHPAISVAATVRAHPPNRLLRFTKAPPRKDVRCSRGDVSLVYTR